MIPVLINDLSYGEVSPKLSGRVGSDVFTRGVAEMLNMRTRAQGGACRRPGMVHVADLTEKVHIVPFVISTDLSFLVQFSHLSLSVRDKYGELVDFSETTAVSSPYKENEMEDVRYAQTYDTIYFVHPNPHPRLLQYSGGAFTWGDIPFTTGTDEQLPFSGIGKYPSRILISDGRLLLFNTLSAPSKFWVSRAGDHFNLSMHDIVTETNTELKDQDEWADPTKPETEKVTLTSTEIPADCAMQLTLGLQRNDSIMWAVAQDQLFIGTQSTEYVMGALDATNPTTKPISAIGSSPIQAILAGAGIFFVKGDGQSVCQQYVDANGLYAAPQVNWTADHITSPGIKSLHYISTPENMLLCLLNDGTIAVYTFDNAHGVAGWSLWKTAGTIEDLAVTDSPNGQIIWAVVERGGARTLERFDYGVYSDAGEPFLSRITFHPLDFSSGATRDRNKRIATAGVRLIESGSFKIGYNGYSEEAHAALAEGERIKDVEVPVPGGHTRNLQLVLSTDSLTPLAVTALFLTAEV